MEIETESNSSQWDKNNAIEKEQLKGISIANKLNFNTLFFPPNGFPI